VTVLVTVFSVCSICELLLLGNVEEEASLGWTLEEGKVEEVLHAVWGAATCEGLCKEGEEESIVLFWIVRSICCW